MIRMKRTAPNALPAQIDGSPGMTAGGSQVGASQPLPSVKRGGYSVSKYRRGAAQRMMR